MSLGTIIRNKRKQLNLTLDQISDSIGFSKPYLSNIETDKVKNPPSDQLLRKLEKILDFENGYLIHIAHMDKLPVDLRGQIETAEAENQKLRHLVKNLFDSKDDDMKIEQILTENQLHFLNTSKENTARLIPIINKVSAGYPADFDDLDYPAGIADDYIRCPDVSDPNAFAVRVVGDSMEPKFFEGDLVIFAPNIQVNNGDDCFIRFCDPHEATFKRIFFEQDKTLRLQPRNDKYPPRLVATEKINGLYRAIRKIQQL